MNRKSICSSKLNAYVANLAANTVVNAYFAERKLVEEIDFYVKQHPYQKLQAEQGIALRTLTLCSAPDVPVIAFVKTVGQLKAVLDVNTGAVVVLKKEGILSSQKVSDEGKLLAALVDVAVEETIHLRKVVVRQAARKRSGKLSFGETIATNSEPFYAFVKQAGPVKAIVNIKTGEARVFANEDVISASKVTDGRFTIDGVTYGKKDTLNGFARYAPLKEAKKSLRKRLSINGPIVTAAMRVLHRL